jgi:predicted DNA-binding transcriptional regulator AlpA
LSRVQAAEYIGVGATKFDEMVDDGRMPKPKRIDGRTVWDRIKLDEAFAAIDESGATSNEWDRLR